MSDPYAPKPRVAGLHAVARSLDELEPLSAKTEPVTGRTPPTHVSLGSVENMCVAMIGAVQRLSAAAVISTRKKMEELEKLYLDAKADYEYAVGFDEKVNKFNVDAQEAEKPSG